jgi:hypothetical protein
MRTRRETVEHPFGTLKMRMGATHFLMKTLQKVATEMATARARLQPHARNEHRRRQTAPGGDPGVRSACCCAHCETVQAWPQVAPGLTPDSLQQKYAQTVVSTWIAPGCVQFLGRKNVFTRPGTLSGTSGASVQRSRNARAGIGDSCCGAAFERRLRHLGIAQVRTPLISAPARRVGPPCFKPAHRCRV